MPESSPLAVGQAPLSGAGLAAWAPYRPWLALALLAFLAYLPTLWAGYVWDDGSLTTNPLLQSLDGLGKIWTDPTLIPQEQHYWPMVYTTFWLEHLLVGFHPLLYHFDNVLLHWGVALALWRLLTRLRLPGAWLAAALFAVHPVHAESVAWAIERKDVLSGVLAMGGALAFLRFCDDSAAGRGWGWYGLTLGLFAAALLSKSAVIGLPLALGALLWWRGNAGRPRTLIALASLALLAAVMTAIDLHFFQGMSRHLSSGLAFPERVLMAGRSLWVYLGKLAWPYPLSTFYTQWPVTLGSPACWLPLLGWGALLAGLWAARRRLGRGPFAALACFSVMVGPALGLLDFEFLHFSYLADRFQYLASAAPLALAAAGLTLLARRLRWPAAVRRGGAAALLAVLGLLCLRQSSFYYDTITLAQAAAAASPQSWAAHFNLGTTLTPSGRGAEAVLALRRAQALVPKPEFLVVRGLAEALEMQRQFPEAERCYKDALRLNPNYNDTYLNYGAFLADQNRLDEAAAQYRELLRRNPTCAVAMSNLGNVLRQQNKLIEAVDSLSRAISLEPDHAEYYTNLARVRLDQKQMDEAAGLCLQALKLDTLHDEGALVFVGQVLLMTGKNKEALAALEKAQELNPQSPETHTLLGSALQRLGNPQEAVRHYQQAARLQPDNADALARLRELGASSGAGKP